MTKKTKKFTTICSIGITITIAITDRYTTAILYLYIAIIYS